MASKTNNERLRDLVEASGLTPAVALTLFNRGLGPQAACPESRWKAFLADPSSSRFQAIDEALLAHAIKAFGAAAPKP